MGWLLVLEENADVLGQIKEVLQQIDPTISVVHFSQSKAFIDWLQLLAKNDTKAKERVPNDKFLGMVSGVELWNFKDIQLIGKFRPLFVQQGLTQNEDEICVVLTGYETPTVNKKRYEHRLVNNFIYKPFDKLFLKQMLEIAFTGRHPVQKYYVHNFKIEAQIEMLKEIRLAEVTEIGFQTVSDQEVAIGKISKYYADFLTTNQHRSALAKAVANEPIPGTQMNRVQLGFFALDQQQSFNLQRMIQKQKKNRPMRSFPSSTKSYHFIFFRDEKSSLCQELEPSVERFFDHPITVVKSVLELDAALKASAKDNPKQKNLLFVDSFSMTGNEVAEVQSLVNQYGTYNLVLHLLSGRIFSEPIERELSALCEDIFYSPFNRSYIIKTLKRRWPDIKTKEDLFESHGDMDHIIHASNPVKVVEVSEAGLVMEYSRPLPIGCFREFIFWMPNEVDVPNLLGQCNHTEKIQGRDGYLCHFIFFGLQDAHLKHIRLWMLHHYIEEKQDRETPA